MSYNTGIPQGTDPINKSQRQMRANYAAIFQAFARNHNQLSGEFPGKHIYLNMTKQESDPVTSSSQTALYVKGDSNNKSNILWMPNNAQTPIQLTYPSISTGNNGAKPPVYLTQQTSFVAGPFVIYAGSVQTPANGAVIQLSAATTLVYCGLCLADATNLQISGAGITSACAATSLNTPTGAFTVNYNFTVNPGVTKFTLYYLAIGKP